MIQSLESFHSSSNDLRLQAVIGTSFTITLLTAFLLLVGCEQKKKYSAEYQELLDKYNQIEEEMTEEQVDAILAGYKARAFSEINEFDHGVVFPRKSTYSKTFFKSGLEEGENVLHVFFDKDKYVVGKSLAGVVK
jgi:hypothetical protein